MNRLLEYENYLLIAILAVCIIIAGIEPYDRLTWLLEVLPVFIGASILIAIRNRFRLSQFVYRLLFIHSLILILGAHYTYARVPPGFWVQEFLGLARNHYDRLGHFAQGFFPAVLVREVLLRRTPLTRGGWLFFLVVSVCLACSAFYEFIEWWAALAGGEAADSFLGTQGDVWDTQWDMFLAMIGAITSRLLLGRFHDRALAKLGEESTLRKIAV